MKNPTVYILASGTNGTLYIGVTSNLPNREWEHHIEAYAGFTSKYGVNKLVWYEHHHDMPTAIQREKSLKRWKRQWKIELIEKTNPNWHRLHPLTGEFIYDE